VKIGYSSTYWNIVKVTDGGMMLLPPDFVLLRHEDAVVRAGGTFVKRQRQCGGAAATARAKLLKKNFKCGRKGRGLM
jgi:hypothetical protein